MKQQTYARVYRFHDAVAFTTDDSTETMYLAPELAQEMAQLLLDCADDIEFGDFVDSALGTRYAGRRRSDDAREIAAEEERKIAAAEARGSCDGCQWCPPKGG